MTAAHHAGPERAGELRRRFVLIAKVEGDTRRDLADAVHALLYQVEADKLGRSSICGGPSSSHIASLTEDETVTHDSYFAALEAELERIKAESAP